MYSFLRSVVAIVSGGLVVLSITSLLLSAKPLAATAASAAGGAPVSQGTIVGPEMAFAAVVGIGGLLFVFRPRRPAK